MSGLAFSKIAEAIRRRGELAVVDECHSLAVLLEHRRHVFRIGQAGAGSSGPGRELRSDIAERREPFTILGRHGGGRVDLTAGDQALERRLHRRPGLCAGGDEVRALVRVVLQIVELVVRRLDELVALIRQREQLAPAEVIARIERFRVDPLRRRMAGVQQQRPEIAAPEPGRTREARQGRHGRDEIEMLDQVGHARAP